MKDEEKRAVVMEKKKVGQYIKLKCRRSKRDKLVPPFERKHLRFSWSKDGKVI